MIGICKIPMSNVCNSQNSEFQCLEKPKLENSNVWNSQNSQFQCLEPPKFRIPMFGNAKIQNSIVWRSQIHNSNVWKRKSPEFQCFAEPKFRIPMFGKAKLHMRSSILTECLPPYIIEWIVVSFHIEEHNRNNRVAQSCSLSNFSPEKRSDHLTTRETAYYILFSAKNRYINKTHTCVHKVELKTLCINFV